jgi:hypothetical protein
MNDDEQPPEVQSPAQRVIVMASFACFVSLAFFYWVARPAVELLEVLWVEWLVYAIIPISVTFTILYRGCWHREITGAARTCSVLLFSCLILAGVLVASGFMFYMGLFCLNAFSGGNH